MAAIVINGGEYQGESVEVSGDRLTFGRSTDCDVILRSKEVSSRHAQLVVRDRVWWLQDLGSSTGTLVRKKRIIQQVLKPGDEFAISQYRFRFTDTPELYSEKGQATEKEIRGMLHGQL